MLFRMSDIQQSFLSSHDDNSLHPFSTSQHTQFSTDPISLACTSPAPTENEEEDSSEIGIAQSPNKRYALWSNENQAQWNTWWAINLENCPQRALFESITWHKPKRSQIWDAFYQAAEIRTSFPKALCKSCWKAYAHPDLRNGGSSTSTLSRHTATKCLTRDKRQTRIDKPGNQDVR